MERSQRLCKSTAPASFNAARPHSTKVVADAPPNKDMSLLDCWILGPEKHRMDNIIRSWECFTIRPLARTTIGCGKQGFPSAQPYLSHTPAVMPFCCLVFLSQPEHSGDEDPVNIFSHDSSWPTPWSPLQIHR
ncbi:conserved hypothetical protein [Aspergillus fumigatus A1163]|uniref:Uncharacterized protein n=1 Tax=Aspergillus fumigatus (strain CBS 144.89 / FGSC A1163 / CEA10) TaxID=451804 RepID=B0YDL6_ASPFC|nr:conserved hypothetical protein [Aspergillus fumigatus A1163]